MAEPSRDRVEDLRRLVAAYLPDRQVDTVTVVGEGLDSIAYQVDGELLVRCSKEPDPTRRAARVQREARLLDAVSGIAPLPVPEPRFTVAEQGCLAYGKLPGVPLLDMPRTELETHASAIAGTLGGLLTALHAAPVERMAALVDPDDQPLDQWLQEAAATYATVPGAVPAPHRRAVEAFLAAPPPAAAYTPVFSHNDLGIEHVLVDPATWRVTGIIDWGDAAITDPAGDFGLLYRDLGPAALDAAIVSYRTDVNDLVALRERATFTARCRLLEVLEDLAYGVQTRQDKYTDKSLVAMAWLFPGR
jgi:aminoglycoside phosphotransferase (APT) family kinase protein